MENQQKHRPHSTSRCQWITMKAENDMLYERVIGRGRCARCGNYAPELTYDRLARKDLCPACLNYFQAQRSTWE